MRVKTVIDISKNKSKITVRIQKVSHFRFCTMLRFTVLCSVFQSEGDLSANIATFVFEMIIFNKGSVFSMIKGAKYIFYCVQSTSNTEKYNKVRKIATDYIQKRSGTLFVF